MTKDQQIHPNGIPPNPHRRGRFFAEEKTMPDGTKKVVIRQAIGTFGPEHYDAFLDAYEKHGMMKKAAASIGVSASAIRTVIAKDQEFARACLEAEETYRDKVVEHVQALVFDGQEKKVYDRAGRLISEEKTYPVQLILAEARRVEEGYRDNKSVNMKVSGGVLFAPAETKSLDDWATRFGGGEIIEGEGTEIKDITPKDENAKSG